MKFGWALSFYTTSAWEGFEVLQSSNVHGGRPPWATPGPAVREVSNRCAASYEVMSGSKKLADFDLENVDIVMEEMGA